MFGFFKYIILLFPLFFNSCGCDLTSENFDLGEQTKNFAKNYKSGDTIYFQCGSDLDTIFIKNIHIEKQCGSPMGVATSRMEIHATHIPNNKWISNINEDDSETEIIFGSEREAMSDSESYLYFNYRDCHTILDEAVLVQDTLLVSLGISKYWLMQGVPPVTDIEYVKTVIWTEKFGLTAYYKNDNRFYTIVSK